MSKQASLNGFVVSSRMGSPLPKKIHGQDKLTDNVVGEKIVTEVVPSILFEQKPNFTAIILKLQPVSYGRCCLCNYRGPLPFCVEYLDAQAVLTCWGDICQNCADKATRGID